MAENQDRAREVLSSLTPPKYGVNMPENSLIIGGWPFDPFKGWSDSPITTP